MLFANEHVAGCAPARGPRESPNDANDRAIRGVAATFAKICGADGDPRRFAGVVLATDDALRRVEEAEGLVREALPWIDVHHNLR